MHLCTTTTVLQQKLDLERTYGLIGTNRICLKASEFLDSSSECCTWDESRSLPCAPLATVNRTNRVSNCTSKGKPSEWAINDTWQYTDPCRTCHPFHGIQHVQSRLCLLARQSACSSSGPHPPGAPAAASWSAPQSPSAPPTHHFHFQRIGKMKPKQPNSEQKKTRLYTYIWWLTICSTPFSLFVFTPRYSTA
jgi:hypothetical protein